MINRFHATDGPGRTQHKYTTIRAVREGFASADRNAGRPMDELFDAPESEIRSTADA